MCTCMHMHTPYTHTNENVLTVLWVHRQRQISLCSHEQREIRTPVCGPVIKCWKCQSTIRARGMTLCRKRHLSWVLNRHFPSREWVSEHIPGRSPALENAWSCDMLRHVSAIVRNSINVSVALGRVRGGRRKRLRPECGGFSHTDYQSTEVFPFLKSKGFVCF